MVDTVPIGNPFSVPEIVRVLRYHRIRFGCGRGNGEVQRRQSGQWPISIANAFQDRLHGRIFNFSMTTSLGFGRGFFVAGDDIQYQTELFLTR